METLELKRTITEMKNPLNELTANWRWQKSQLTRSENNRGPPEAKGVGGTGLQLRTEEVTGVKVTVWKM